MDTQPTRYTRRVDLMLPRIAIDLGYSALQKSCGFATSHDTETVAFTFGACIEATSTYLREQGAHCLILEAVLSTYHTAEGNPAIRGDFEKGRGWYHGPGVTTYAAALRFLQELDRNLPDAIRPIPLVEGFLSYKAARTTHTDDAQRMLLEFDEAEIFQPHAGSEPIIPLIEGVPEIRRYNRP